jgi:hypothetical protein
MAATLKASSEGLQIIDQARRQKGWTKKDPKWCGDADTSKSTLDRFWRKIPIQQETFALICQSVGIINWQDIVDQTPIPSTNHKAEFFAYDEAWVGRDNLVSELLEKVNNSCRVLIITGITGIGKTALAEYLTEQLSEDWLGGNWHHFRREIFEDETGASDLGSVAARWLEKWGEKLTPDDRKDPEQLLSRLLNRLENNRHLVLMDSLEKILEGNEEEGWNDFQDEWWVKFLECFLAAESCQSRILITSQDFPTQIPERYQKFWFCHPLKGLEAPEQIELFRKTGLTIESQFRVYLERIGNAYEGHPLALRVIAGEIGSQRFKGNVVAYWNKYGNEIEEVEKALAEAKEGITASKEDKWRLHNYTKELRRTVRSRLEITFQRLEKEVINAYRLLCEASVYRCAVPDEFWLSHLEDWDCDEDEQELALEMLGDRYLVETVIENDQSLLRQHNLIRSVALEHLKKWDEEDNASKETTE